MPEILHLVHDDKYVQSFRNSWEAIGTNSTSTFLCHRTTDKQLTHIDDSQNWEFYGDASELQHFLQSERYDIVIIHFYNFIISDALLRIKKTGKIICWVVWGADLYSRIRYPIYDSSTEQLLYGKRSVSVRKKIGVIKRFIFRRVKDLYASRKIIYILTFVNRDYRLARRLVPFARQIEFFYPEVTTEETPVDKDETNMIHNAVLVGNSGDPSNNHVTIIDALSLNDERIKVYCPLSYGSTSYIQKIIPYGERHLGDRFLAIRDYMSAESYRKMLSNVDAGIFAHKRQQGFGNVRSLIMLQKTVFLRRSSVMSEWLSDIGIAVRYLDALQDGESIAENLLSADVLRSNRNIIQSFFSPERMKELYSQILKMA
jgi:dTDP-N-acetylfucosamine:lipid II N-acetylfucosaminyltransferase